MRNTAIIDAGPLIALFDRSDRYHVTVKEQLEQYRRSHLGKLISTWPILTETAYLLSTRVHLQAELDFLNWVSWGGVEVFDLKRDALPRIMELQIKYADLPMDFSDATLLVAAEILDINQVFTLDKDFLLYRTLKKKHFENLL